MSRVADKTILAIIHAKTIEPDTSNASLAKRFKVSETTVSNYTIHIKLGQKKTLEELRDWVNTRFDNKKCTHCGRSISRRSRGLCKVCYLRRGDPNMPPKPPKRTVFLMESCPKSPTLNHHWMLDTFNKGVCKHCKSKKEFHPWDDYLVDSFKEEWI